jgi:ABC-type multidrug transport system ATPase subunit
MNILVEPLITPSVMYHPMLETRNLTKAFGKVVAVNDVSLMVNKGELFGLLGTNGAGKTTTMKIFSCLLKPSSGQALVDGLDVVKSPIDVKRRIGYMPEAPPLYDKLTGREFLLLLGRLRAMPPEDLDKQVEYFSKTLELGQFLDMEIGSYSKGMRQRVAFASALLHSPPVLILDEPTAGLDPRFAKLVKGWIRDYVNNGGTVLMSTHVTEVAESLCDRVGVIHLGRIVGLGTPAELRSRTGAGNLEDAFVRLVEPQGVEHGGPVGGRPVGSERSGV